MKLKCLFHLGHPAHFHLFKNVIGLLKTEGHEAHILIKEKDVLRELLDASGYKYLNILPEGKKPGLTGEVFDLFKRGKRIYNYSKKLRPDVLVGTSVDISYTGTFLKIPSVNVNEDDAQVVPLYSWLAYPFATKIISPVVCNNGRWQSKTVNYQGYHELAYLHPDLFQPSKRVAENILDLERKNFLLRFSGLKAHHDHDIRGINNELAVDLVTRLRQYGDVLITSERPLIPELEQHRLKIKASDIHHILAFVSLVIGDSQTMSAEAGVLGTPYIRFNDFVGKISYLKELEEVYELGFGVTPDHPEKLLAKAEEIAKLPDTSSFELKRDKMLSEKIDVVQFLYEEITNTVNSKC
jgi:hypothetical protein